MITNYGMSPTEFDRSSIRRSAVDTCVAFYLKYIGSEESGEIAIANTTGDIAFTHGDEGSEAADTTVNPNGGTPGTIDLSDEAATFALIDTLVNLSPNWEFWYECALPSDDSEDSGTSKIINNIAATPAKIDGGYAVLIDTSATLYHSIGLTSLDQNTNLSGSDAGWYHELTQVRATTTYSSGTSTINIYRVLDSDATVTLIDSHAGGATTAEKVLPTGGEQWPIYNEENHRLVVKVVNSVAMTAADMTIFFGSHKFGPSTRKSRTWSTKSI